MGQNILDYQINELNKKILELSQLLEVVPTLTISEEQKKLIASLIKNEIASNKSLIIQIERDVNFVENGFGSK